VDMNGQSSVFMSSNIIVEFPKTFAKIPLFCHQKSV